MHQNIHLHPLLTVRFTKKKQNKQNKKPSQTTNAAHPSATGVPLAILYNSLFEGTKKA